MTKRLGLSLRVRACPRCGGADYREDAADDDWRCLQCARSVPPPKTAASVAAAKAA